MKAYRVVRPWFGVQVGAVVKTDSLHPALASHVELIQPREEAADEAKLEVATPTAPSKPDGGKGKKKKG